MKNAAVLLYDYFARLPRNLSPLHTDHARKVWCVIPLQQKDKKKSEPISDFGKLGSDYTGLVRETGLEPA